MKNRRGSHVGVFVCAKVRGRERRRDREGEREGRGFKMILSMGFQIYVN